MAQVLCGSASSTTKISSCSLVGGRFVSVTLITLLRTLVRNFRNKDPVFRPASLIVKCRFSNANVSANSNYNNALLATRLEIVLSPVST